MFIGISELWKCEGDFRLNLSGYHKLLVKIRQDYDRGGVGQFVKESINYRVRKDLSVFIPRVFESLFVEITNTSVSSKNKIIGIIYRPNTQPRANLDIFSSTLTGVIDVI